MSISLAVAVRDHAEQLDRLHKAIEALAVRVSTLEQAPPPKLTLKPRQNGADGERV